MQFASLHANSMTELPLSDTFGVWGTVKAPVVSCRLADLADIDKLCDLEQVTPPPSAGDCESPMRSAIVKER